MREDGGLIGYGMATAVYGVPAVERLHAALPAALWARSCLLAMALRQEGSFVQVPITVEPPTGRFTACVVST